MYFQKSYPESNGAEVSMGFNKSYPESNGADQWIQKTWRTELFTATRQSMQKLNELMTFK